MGKPWSHSRLKTFLNGVVEINRRERNMQVRGRRFRDKNTQATYRVKAANDWIVLLEKEDGSAQILTSLNILKSFYEKVDDGWLLEHGPGPSEV
jgi:hypothetical protein